MIDKEALRQRMAKWKENPSLFLTQALDVKKENIWDKMMEVIEAVRDNDKIAVKAGHSVSKSYVSARLALWFLYCYRPSTVITTAPSNSQVEEILWREIRDAHTNAKIPLGGAVTKTKIDLAEKWFALGFSTRPDTVTDMATRFQGFHNQNVMVIFDEAAGILPEIWQSAESLLASGNTKFLVIGNPTSAKGDFVKCFSDPSFKKITISVLDTPNYIQSAEVIPGISGRKFENDIATKYGKQSNYYIARVLGQIPKEDIDTIIQLAWIENAEKRIEHSPKSIQKFVACDPADGGDETVAYYMENTDIIDSLIFTKKNTMITAGMVKVFMTKHQTNIYAGDSIGIGTGIADRLEEMGSKVIRVNSAERQKSGVPEIYYNRRSQMWIESGEMFSMGEITLTHTDEVLREQLTAVKQTVRNGKILIEPKETIRKNLGRSPDRADAYILGLYALKSNQIQSMTPEKKKSSFKQIWDTEKKTTAMSS